MNFPHTSESELEIKKYFSNDISIAERKKNINVTHNNICVFITLFNSLERHLLLSKKFACF